MPTTTIVVVGAEEDTAGADTSNNMAASDGNDVDLRPLLEIEKEEMLSDDENIAAEPWRQPDLRRAKVVGRNHTFRGGKQGLWATGPGDFNELGPGIALYFRVVRYLGYLTLFVTFMSMPTMILCSAGSRISPAKKDPLGTVVFSLGNFGAEDSLFLVSGFNRSVTTTVDLWGSASFEVEADVPVGHKVCVRPILRGEKVLKYGASIGSATSDIRPGQHVHTHNLESDYLPSRGRVDS